MTRFMIRLPLTSAFLLFLGLGLQAQAADVYLESSVAPQFFRTNSESGDRTSYSNIQPESGLGFDLRSTLGLVFWSQLLVGFTTNYSVLPQKRDAATIRSDSGDVDYESMDDSKKRLEGGPSIGYLLGDFRLVATYFLSGYNKQRTKAVAVDGTTAANRLVKDEVSGGYQILLGWTFPLAGNLKIGPSLIYRNITYDRQDATNYLDRSDSSTNYKNKKFATKPVDATLEPMLTVSFAF